MKVKITYQECNQRFDKYVKKILQNAPLSLIYRFIRQGKIKINGKKATINTILTENDEIDFYISEEKYAELSSKDQRKIERPVEVLFEDRDLFIINKPAGTEVQQNGKIISIIDIVRTYIEKRDQQSVFIAPCHRLDVNTTGLLIFAKTVTAAQSMQALFKERKISKKYLTIVAGKISPEGIVTSYLLKDSKLNKVFVSDDQNGKEAILSYHLVDYFDDFSLIEVEIHTGRTHQVRAQLASIGHPLIGDGKYGDFLLNRELSRKYKLEHFLLHASSIKFVHPITLEKIALSAPMQEKMKSVMEKLSKNKNRYL